MQSGTRTALRVSYVTMGINFLLAALTLSGCAVPEVDNRMHGDDEFMEIPMLVRSTKIFADAILRLCGA